MTDPLTNKRQTATRDSLAGLLNLTLALFLITAGVSLLDDTLVLGFGVHAFSFISGLLFLALILASILVYLLSGLSPMVPKRLFVPIALFIPAAQLAMLPLLIYHYDWVQQIAWITSLLQVLCGLSILFWVQGTFRVRWPLVRQEHLGSKLFSWLNLSGFVLANLCVLLPLVCVYLFICASLAVDHFSGNFLALRANGLSVRAKTYVRDDHKTIQLIPMMHIGEANFYDQISKSLPTNSVILLEGVTDDKKLMKHKLSYKRAAQSLGLVEQQEEFVPPQGRIRQTDVDMDQFSEGTIAFLNRVSLIHSEGWKMEDLLKLIQESGDPRFAEQLWDDLLTKRNANLLKQIEAELPGSDVIVAPWGAAHMRGIAAEIQKLGFHLADTQEHQILHFRSLWKRLFQKEKKRAGVSGTGVHPLSLPVCCRYRCVATPSLGLSSRIRLATVSSSPRVTHFLCAS